MKSTYYVFSTGFGGGFLRLSDVAYSNEFSVSRDKATRFQSVTIALTELQNATRRWGNEVGNKGTSILSNELKLVRVDEVTTPGAQTLSLSSTLEPTGKTDRFVVITQDTLFGGTEEVIAGRARGDRTTMNGHGHYVKSLNELGNIIRSDTHSFPTLLVAVKAVAAAQFELSFVAIRRLVITEGAPTTKTTTTVLA